MLIRIFCVGLLCLLAVGCTGGSRQSIQATDAVAYNYDTKIDSDAVGDQEKNAVAEKINKRQILDFTEITKMLVARDQAQYLSGGAELSQERVSNLDKIAAVLKQKDYLDFKSTYETLVNPSGDEIMYQPDAVTVFHLTEQKLMQCFSGTNMNLIMTRMARKGSDYRQQNYVVIVKPGHVLPGQMIMTKDGWYLIGIETTAAGDALINFGAAKTLNEAMRVVDAEDYVISEVFADGLGGDRGQAFVKESIERTAKKFGISLVTLENQITAVHSSARAQNTLPSEPSVGDSRAYNSSIFAFAPPEILPKEPVRRSTMGTVSHDEFNKNLSIINAPKSAVIGYVQAPVRFVHTGVEPNAAWPSMDIYAPSFEIQYGFDGEAGAAVRVGAGFGVQNQNADMPIVRLAEYVANDYSPATISSLLHQIYFSKLQTANSKDVSMGILFGPNYGAQEACAVSTNFQSAVFNAIYVKGEAIPPAIDYTFAHNGRKIRVRCEMQGSADAHYYDGVVTPAWTDFWSKTLGATVVGATESKS